MHDIVYTHVNQLSDESCGHDYQLLECINQSVECITRGCHTQLTFPRLKVNHLVANDPTSSIPKTKSHNFINQNFSLRPKLQ